VLATTLKRKHPDWAFDLMISQPLPDLDWSAEPFDRVLTVEDLSIENPVGWVFTHQAVEVCTAVKGPAAAHILDSTGTDKLIYLDPDIAVFNSLDALSELLDDHPILLTPHQVQPEQTLDAIVDNEICSLKHGVYNLGFLAIRNEGQGRDFVNWWRDRLLHFCYDDIPNGLFTDQRWCDLAPAFFDELHIIRAPEYNVATWNLAHRDVVMTRDGTIHVDGAPLRFYHFTGFDSGAGATMARKYAPDEHIVHEMWAWYIRQLEVHGQEAFGAIPWTYDAFDNGVPITPRMRRLYRHRRDLQEHFTDPFDTRRADGGFLAWWRTEHAGQDGTS
jgi:hypothetical protein